MLVYGTRGTTEENQWAVCKARFDAEQFYYRGNGSVDVMSDAAFLAQPRTKRNVVLYGNQTTNLALNSLLGAGSIHLLKDHAENHAAALFIAKARDGRLVGVISGTDLEALRLTDRLPYFTSGVGYPDWVTFTPEVLQSGNKGVVAAGYGDPQGR
jgi:CBS domain-containing protein